MRHFHSDAYGQLHDHNGVIGQSDVAPIELAVSLLNKQQRQIASLLTKLAEKGERPEFKTGDLVICQIITRDLFFSHIKPMPKTELRVKKAPALMQALVDMGYTPSRGGDWTCQGKRTFGFGQWVYCGGSDLAAYAWEPEWLEEVSV